MEFDSLVTWFSSPIQIAFLDLVLGADNAVIIALVCRTLPRRHRRFTPAMDDADRQAARALWLGAVARSRLRDPP